MKLTEELIECQTREAERVSNKYNVWFDAEMYRNGALWAFYAMKDELRESKSDYFVIGFMIGGIFVFFC